MAKKNSLREWFGKNDGKGWLTVKQANPVVVRKEKNAEVIRLVDLPWRNVLLRQRKRNRLSVLAGRTKKLLAD